MAAFLSILIWNKNCIYWEGGLNLMVEGFEKTIKLYTNLPSEKEITGHLT
jgi:hypothetical protein